MLFLFSKIIQFNKCVYCYKITEDLSFMKFGGLFGDDS